MKLFILLTLAVVFLVVGIILLQKELAFRKATVIIKGRTIGYIRKDFVTDEPLYHNYYLEAVFKCPYTNVQRKALSSTATSNPSQHVPSHQVTILVQKTAPHSAKIASITNFFLSGSFLFMGLMWLLFAVTL